MELLDLPWEEQTRDLLDLFKRFRVNMRKIWMTRK
jgi:hypothetical protein